MFKFVRSSLNINIRNFCSNYKTTSISNIFSGSEQGKKIKIQGWVKSLRKMKENVFIDISDGSSDHRLQVLIPTTKKPSDLTTGASILASGCMNITSKGQLELTADEISVTGQCVIANGFPFAPRKSYPPEYIREYLHLRPRTNKFASLLRVRHAATKAIHNHFDSEGYFNIHTPILTSNDCEGAGEVFSVRPENKSLLKNMAKHSVTSDEAYFDTKVFLTVSGQLHLEAVTHGLSKVYSFGPTFRAENSKSRLHLSEFYMIEAETAFVNNIEDVAETIEKLIKNVTKNILDSCDADIARLHDSEERDLSWVDKKFVMMTYDEALNLLNKNKDKFISLVQKEEGFTKEHEIFLVNLNGGIPVFIINWPKDGKPFYMRSCPNDINKVAALDLLAPHVGEIAGGSLREHDYATLKTKLPPGKAELDWYLELRKFGGVPTGGFGVGFERYLQMLLAINNIKDTIPFPRSPHNCQL